MKNLVRTAGSLLASTNALMLAFASPAQAQSANASQASSDAASLMAEATTIQASATSNSPTFGTLANTVQIETDGDKTNATLSLGYRRTKPIRQVRNGSSFDVTSATDSLSVTVSAPLGKGGKPSVFDFDKLGDGTSVEFKAVRYWGTAHFLDNNDPASMQQIENRKNGRCIYGESDRWAARQSDFAKAQKTNLRFRRELDTALGGTTHDYAPALQIVTGSADAEVKGLASELLSCIGAVEKPTLGSADDYITAEDRQATQSLRSGTKFFGISGAMSRTNYEFVVQTPLGKDDVSHTGYKTQMFGGYIFPSGNFSLGGGFAYARRYTPADEVELCGPNAIPSQTQCFTGPLGAPSRSNAYTFSGELRWRLPLPMLSENAAIGIAPRASYEIKSDSALLELPIYFVPEKGKSSLSGGIRMAYNTGKKDFAIGLFVGVPFSIFYN